VGIGVKARFRSALASDVAYRNIFIFRQVASLVVFNRQLKSFAESGGTNSHFPGALCRRKESNRSQDK
jgi:hypothetical protein